MSKWSWDYDSEKGISVFKTSLVFNTGLFFEQSFDDDQPGTMGPPGGPIAIGPQAAAPAAAATAGPRVSDPTHLFGDRPDHSGTWRWEKGRILLLIQNQKNRH